MTVDRRKGGKKRNSRSNQSRIVPQRINIKVDSIVILYRDGKSKVFEVKYLVAQTFL